MTKIESDKVTVENSAKNVFDYLCDLNNLRKLMPEDRINNWNSTKEECSFAIKGLSKINMKLAETSPPSKIVLESQEKKPFPFKLNILIEGKGDDQCEAQIFFEGDINPFMKMMVEKPLTNFFNMLVGKLKGINE